MEASSLIGTIMNCAISQLVGPTYQSGTHFFPLDPTIKIACDVMEYCIKNIPRWNILNINAYNMRETGINAVQEIAFAFSLVSEYIRHLLARGMEIDQFAPRIAFFTSAHIDFLEEVAKLRAMRRIWAHLMKDTFHAKNERSCWFRTAIQTSSLPLTAQQPLNNIVRATIQTLVAVLGGSQSIHTTSYDEAHALPTEESHILSIRTQQIIAYETGVCRSADPLGGSYAIERLTDEIEERAIALMEEIEKKGGFLECFKSQWIEKQINEARYEYARQLEAGEQIQVGVNMERDEEEEVKINIFRQASDMQAKRIRYIREYKQSREGDRVKKVLENLYHQVRENPMGNWLPTIIEAVEQKATIGEISDTLRQAYDFIDLKGRRFIRSCFTNRRKTITDWRTILSNPALCPDLSGGFPPSGPTVYLISPPTASFRILPLILPMLCSQRTRRPMAGARIAWSMPNRAGSLCITW
jgi:methylmalonyl-CoA mutase N-terminal domain/subunit